MGVAVFDDFAYVSQVYINQIARMELTTDTVTEFIGVGSHPCIIAFNSTGTRAYTANLLSDYVSVIDVASGQEIGQISVSGNPLPVALASDDATLFVTTDADRLFKIDLGTNTVTGSLGLPATSHHLLLHPNGDLLYVATRDGGSVLEVNWHTMSVVRTFALGGRPQAMAIAADQSELYVANEMSGLVQIITLSSGTIDSVALSSGGEGIALGGDGKLYVGEVFAGRVQVVDPATRTVVRTITVGGTPKEVASDPKRNRVLVTNEDGWVDLIRY
jgi:YVTN family beta-propeller protein